VGSGFNLDALACAAHVFHMQGVQGEASRQFIDPAVIGVLKMQPLHCG
jgi:hypothetical protein